MSHSILHTIAEARFYAQEDLVIAKGIGIYEDVMDAIDMLHLIGEAETTVLADDWNEDTLSQIITIGQFVNDHRSI